jgi:hypothetical protein
MQSPGQVLRHMTAQQKKDAERLTFDIGGIYIRDRYCLLLTYLFYYFFVKIQL